jgi:hypothetical protein
MKQRRSPGRNRKNTPSFSSEAVLQSGRLEKQMGKKDFDRIIEELGFKLADLCGHEENSREVIELRALIVDICLLSKDPKKAIESFDHSYNVLCGMKRSSRSGSCYCDVKDKRALAKLKKKTELILTVSGLKKIKSDAQKHNESEKPFMPPEIKLCDISSIGRIVNDTGKGPSGIDTTHIHQGPRY